jgi:hypothetical protein
VRGPRGFNGTKKWVGRKRVAFAAEGPDLAAKLALERHQAGAVSAPDMAMIRPPGRTP